MLLVPSVYAWDYEGHKAIVEYVYYSTDMQFKFNLSRLQEGAIAPDKIFRDQRRHHYPDTLALANKWLNNNSDISYNFGVASHYISDSFVSPHYVKNEKYKDHMAFEKQAVSINMECKYYNFNFDKELARGALNVKDWKYWLRSRDKKIPQREMDQAVKLVLSVAIKKFNLTCIKKTRFEDHNVFKKAWSIIH